MIDADEGTGAGHLGRVEGLRSRVELRQELIDLREPEVGLVRQVLAGRVLGFESLDTPVFSRSRSAWAVSSSGTASGLRRRRPNRWP